MAAGPAAGAAAGAVRAVMLSGLAGSALVVVGIAHLAVETWMGISATDEQLRRFTAGHEQVSR